MSRTDRCILEHPHPGRECRDRREVYRNRWGNGAARPVVEQVDGQLDMLEAINVDPRARTADGRTWTEPPITGAPATRAAS